ncbi:NADP-dependent oxidoreductase domain-containing protein [Thelonectria olida]|uniref:NADP-dependent oxidoreductase domain-containing protein n=1 Tax=Thelonectria olida TaxID=1576542 RepID=A0A9P8VPI2_9HYPO|nr:NADP-dependent oxidoreductase domain-containing protein [Thelonectria olida]
MTQTDWTLPASGIYVNDRIAYSQLGYGTWQSSPGEVASGIFEALRVGYRHLVCFTYGNQLEVAQGLQKAFKEIPGLRRFRQHNPDECLDELGLDYLDAQTSEHVGKDLFPLTENGDVAIDDGVSIVETWKAMTKLPKSNARSIGVSNHTIEQLEAIIKATYVVPAANQVERHPLLRQDDLVAYCKDKNIHLTAYSAFGNNMFNIPLLFSHPAIQGLAEKLSTENGTIITPAQILLSWAQNGGHGVIPKSVTPVRIAENYNEITMSDDDIRVVESIGEKQQRYNVPYVANGPRWDVDIAFTIMRESTNTSRNMS